MTTLPRKYYQNHDVLYLAKDLLGKVLKTNIDGVITGGVIIETEAYRAPDDRASHAFGYRRTKRNEVMYSEGGVCYVFQCYGIHAMFNVVTSTHNVPHAILIRAIQPTIGLEAILKRRNKIKMDRTVAGGPGTLAQALGITREHNGLPLTGPTVWIEDEGIVVPDEEIVTSPRVGIDYAGEDALLPWRFQWMK